jgi:alkanesulfonate monooxygenase SsuD/methylene tetrahydromethanopterin reductase-like flavin-dependent oxidoreductase (luciferase family)
VKVGLALMLQNVIEGVDDGELIRDEVQLAVEAEQLGFDFVSFPEHHFGGYSMSVDNGQVLSYIAARTSVLRLMYGVVILPWHDPLRVAERILLLDSLSNGRVDVGFGRGMAPREYQGLGINMEESRGRFDEAAEMVVRALDTGVIKGNGPFYPQIEETLRPRPARKYGGKITSVAMSPNSALAAARIGARMMSFISLNFEDHAAMFSSYKAEFERLHSSTPPPPVFSDKTVCRTDGELARKMFEEHYLTAYHVEREHYELDSDLFAQGKVKGYESYQAAAQKLQASSVEDAAAVRANSLAYGTPDDIIGKIESRISVLGGDITAMFCPVFGGLPIEEARKTMRALSKHVLPVLHGMGTVSRQA